MKYRVINTMTGNFASKSVDASLAYGLCEKLNRASQKYLVVPLGFAKKAKVLKPMNENVKLAIKKFKDIKFSGNSSHVFFANAMLGLVANKFFKLTERQESFIWGLIYHYRAQVRDAKLIYLAKLNRVD